MEEFDLEGKSRVGGSDSKTSKVQKNTSEELTISLGDFLGGYEMNEGNFFVLKDIQNKDKSVNKSKLGVTIIQSEKQLIETVVIDINPDEYDGFNKYKGNTFNFVQENIDKLPRIAKPGVTKTKQKSDKIEYKVNPTNLDYLNLGNKALVEGKIMDFTIVEYSVNQGGKKSPSIGILTLKTKEKRLISVHVEIYKFGQKVVKALVDGDGKNIKIKTVVGKYKVQNIDINSVSDNDILLPHLYDIQEKEQFNQKEVLELQMDIDHCNEAIDKAKKELSALKKNLNDLIERDEKYTIITSCQEEITNKENEIKKLNENLENLKGKDKEYRDIKVLYLTK